MKLYYAPGACSLSPHIALREAGLPFELVRVDLRAKRTDAGDDYNAVNPKGSVPALTLDGGEVLTEGPAIVQYIADQAPASGLAPANGTLDRYRLQEWLNFITSELHKTYSPLFKPDTPDAYKDTTKANIAKRFDMLDGHLARRPHLMGEAFTVADAYLFVVASWSKRVGIDLSRWPNMTAFMDRVAARPRVQEAMEAEGLTS